MVKKIIVISILASLVLGCSATRETDQNLNEPVSNISTDSTFDNTPALTDSEFDTQANEANPGQAAALNTDEVVFSPVNEKVGMKVSISNESEDLFIVPGTKKIATYKKLRLSNPERLVLDIPDAKSTKTGDFDLDKTSWVKRVRVAQRDTGARFVFDLGENVKDEPTIRKVDGGLAVGFVRSSQKAANQVAVDTQAVANTNVEPGNFETEQMALGQIDEAASQLTLEDLKFSTDRENPSEQSIFAKFSAGMGAGAESNQPIDFTLSKTAPSEYVLKVRKAAIAQDVSSTVLTQSAKNSIRSARPVAKNGDLLIRIFAKPEVTLKAENRSGGIKIYTSSMDASDSDMRAQLAPEKTEPTQPTSASADGGKADVQVKDGATLAYNDGESVKYTGRLISLDLQDTDIDNALRIIAEVSNLNIIASDDVSGKVTLRLIDVPWDQALDVILKTNNLDKVQEGNVVRIAPVERLKAEREALKQARQAEQELEPLEVKYLRVSYSKASEVKALIESVLTERGNVAYDERTNQLIVKDISSGLKHASELVSKLDLRTPQVLLETQIVEANRNLLRDLGSEFGYRYLQSPEIGNATGSNFPNSVDLNAQFTNPAEGNANPIRLLLGSADGSKSISAVLTQIENEGRARVVSRPSVATLNNRPATIKSVEKIRIRLPSGGVSVATGQGANASGQAQSATETIEVGIVLEVTPQASPDYYVLLDVNAKSSTLGVTSTDGIPNEIERSAISSVLVSSGQTFALGGIYKIQERDTNSGVPFFKDIPFLGTLFRRVRSSGTDEELLFFITPRIVEGSFDDAAMKS